MIIKYSNFCINIPKKFKNCKLSDFDFKGNENLEKFIYNWQDNKNGFCLYGGIGLGKTMLISTIYRILCYHYNCIFVTFSDLVESLRDTETKTEYMETFICYKYIIVDDLFKNLDKKIYTEKDYRNINMFIDLVYDYEINLICTSMYGKKELADNLIGWENMLSRIVEMCKFVKIEGMDRRI